MLLTLSHIPPIGDWKAAFGSNLIGIGVLSVGVKVKFCSNFTSASFVCMIPNRLPMQILGPSPDLKIKLFVLISQSRITY